MNLHDMILLQCTHHLQSLCPPADHLFLASARLGRFALFQSSPLLKGGRVYEVSTNVVFLFHRKDTDDPVFRSECFLCREGGGV